MTAQQAYVEDCRRCPNYDDGAPRKTWDQLDALAQSAWEKKPTPREFKQGRGSCAAIN